MSLRSLRRIVCAFALSASPVIPLAQELAGAPRTAWLDLDGDGLVDVHVFGGPAQDRLLHNLGAGAFEDVASVAGLEGVVSRGALWGDLDRDGAPDLLAFAPTGAAQLFHGRPGVVELAPVVCAGLDAAHGATQADLRDVDADGWLDVTLSGPDGVLVLRNQRGGEFEVLQLVESPILTGIAVASAMGPGAATPETPGTDAGAPVVARWVSGSHASSTPRRGPTPSMGSGGGPELAVAKLLCAKRVEDVATGACVSVSSVPLLGALLPLGLELNVDAQGRVGMGTTLPTHRLMVQGAGADTLRLVSDGPFGSGSTLNLGDADYVYVREDVDDSLELHATGRTAITGGPVGVGTAAPFAPLHVLSASFPVLLSERTGSSTSAAATTARFVHSTDQEMQDGFGPLLVLAAADATSGGALDLATVAAVRDGLDTDGKLVMTTRKGGLSSGLLVMEADGDVGIGTATPSATLEVVDTSGPAVLSTVTDGNSVLGITQDANLAAVVGVNLRTTGSAYGAGGESHSSTGVGVQGNGYIGVRGVATSGPGFTAIYGLFSVGDLGATGVKSFVQPHPEDAGREVRFVCLEGNEAGTYFRGTGRTVGGRARIEVPEEFRLVTEERGLTVQLTPIGPASLWIESQDLESISVGASQEVAFHYFVNGVRRGFTEHESIGPNRTYVPAQRGVPYGADLPHSLRRILVQNGTLNEDYTPNEETALRLGWTLSDPAPTDVP